MNFLQRYQGQLAPLRSERRAELLVVVLLALLLLQLAWGAYRSAFPAIPEPVLPTAEALEIGSLRSAPPLPPELRNEIRQRPLFWVSRRPVSAVAPLEQTAAAQAKAEQRQAAKIAGLELAGVFGAGEAAGIIVLAKEKNKKHRVMAGQEINGWTLESVSPTEAVLSSNGRQATLALERGKIWVTEMAPEPEALPAPVVEAPQAKPDAAKPAQQPGRPEKKKAVGGDRKKPAGNKDSLSLGRGS